MAACGRAERLRTSWPISLGLKSLRSSAAGRHCKRSVGRSNRRAHANRNRLALKRQSFLKKPREGGCRRSQQASRHPGRERFIVPALANARSHGPENLPGPDGIRLVYQPSYSPELQPAEHLWPLVDEPLVNKHFETIDDLDTAVAKRCCTLHEDQKTIAKSTKFHWWPKSIKPN